VNDDDRQRYVAGVQLAALGTVLTVLAVVFGVFTFGLSLLDFLVQLDPTTHAPPPETTAAPETTAPLPESERKAEPGQQGPPLASGQGSASGGDSAEPESVKSSTCLLAAKPSDPRISTAESAELIVDLSVPSHARECHDTVTIDAPTFSMGKEPEQTVSVVPPPKSDAQHWLLEPEKVGVWKIAVETKEERDIVSLIVTTPLGFSAIWVQAGVIAAGVTTLVLGALAIILRRG
jgi:hypothetical protein